MSTHQQAPVLLRAGCKINLGLAITGLREDRYHLIDSIFYPLQTPCDLLRVDERKGPAGLTVHIDAHGIDPENNTLTKAWKVFAEQTGFAPALDVHLEKGIPWGAGLGGGSADAAALLRHLSERSRENGVVVDDQTLAAMAARVGADVPFFLWNRPMWVTGIGDILEPVDLDLSPFYLVLVMPPMNVSTPWAYKSYDELCLGQHAKGRSKVTENSHSGLKALTDMVKVRKKCLPIQSPVELINDLEPVVFRRYPGLRNIKELLLDHGACTASMSGSGSSIFALFTDRAQAQAAALALEWPVHLSSLAGM